MAKARTRQRPPSPRRRRHGGRHPRRRRTRGRLLQLVVAAVALGAVVAFLALRGGGESESGRPFVGSDLHSLVLDPADPSRLYVGGHDAVAVSGDGGGTWERVETLDGADAMGWAFLSDRVLVGGHPGLWVSEDRGRMFELRNERLPATDIHALGAGGGVVYAGSPEIGVFASSDEGRTWEVRTRDVGQAFMGTILVDPRDPERLVAPDMRAGAVESTDGGRTWRALGGVPGAMWVTWARDDPDRLIVSGMGEAAESADGGRSWTPLEVPESVQAVEMSPDESRLLYAAAHEGTAARVWFSRDGGATWARP